MRAKRRCRLCGHRTKDRLTLTPHPLCARCDGAWAEGFRCGSQHGREFVDLEIDRDSHRPMRETGRALVPITPVELQEMLADLHEDDGGSA